ncbi:MAG: FAD-binding oxidoreductase [Cyanobacteria bacterium P01_C01_bin.89]
MSNFETWLAALPNNAATGLARADGVWEQVRSQTLPRREVLDETVTALGMDAETAWDGVIAGGTLGIVLGLALVQRGWRILVVERGALQGRSQEWNSSRLELGELVSLGLLTAAELEEAIASEYNPVRIKFDGGKDYWVRDVLNVGISPAKLLSVLKEKFLAAGGILWEKTAFESATVHPDGVSLILKKLGSRAPVGAGGQGSADAYRSIGDSDKNSDEVSQFEQIQTRLFIDAMGHFSPVVRQVRGETKPDGICLVVGTCAVGNEGEFGKNDTADLIATTGPITGNKKSAYQYFWEAFPASSGRTTYMFTYVDASRDRPTLKQLFADYYDQMPAYQGLEGNPDALWRSLEVKRALFGMFPSYKNSPLSAPCDRLIFVGDSSGCQSPLSFGGFAALLRHLPRLTDGIHSALTSEKLDKKSLNELQPYQPNLSVTWLFQQSMSVKPGDTPNPQGINILLDRVFGEMAIAGESIIKPFLQDVVQFPALSVALMRTAFADPLMVTTLVPRLGLPALTTWMRHYLSLGAYDVLDRTLGQLKSDDNFRLQQWQAAWRYGSGRDYHS